jgi:hypothetical protein
MYLQAGSAYLYHAADHALTVPNIAIGAVLSVSILRTCAPPWRIGSGALAIVSTVLSSLAKHVNAGERAQLHCHAVRQYQALVHDIDVRLLETSLTEEEKTWALRLCKLEMDKVLSTQPEPMFIVVKHFERKYQDSLEHALYPEFEAITIRHADAVNRRISLPVRSSTYASARSTNVTLETVGTP